MASPAVAPSGEYLTTGQVAVVLGSTSQHVRELIKAGHLEAIDIAKGDGRPRFRVPKAAFAEFIRERTVPTTEAA